jgi:hypothetical protein
MTDEQLFAFKYYLDAKIAHAMSPIFANEMALERAEEEFDRAMGDPVSSPE